MPMEPVGANDAALRMLERILRCRCAGRSLCDLGPGPRAACRREPCAAAGSVVMSQRRDPAGALTGKGACWW
jgi:hypothetical protein